MNKLLPSLVARCLRDAIPYLAETRQAYRSSTRKAAGMCLATVEAVVTLQVVEGVSGLVRPTERALGAGLTKAERKKLQSFWLPTVSLEDYKPEHYTARVMWLELMAIMAEEGAL